MKPHPRIRKTIKWGGAAVTVLLVIAWIGSGWWAAGGSVAGVGHVSIIGGVVSVVHRRGPPDDRVLTSWTSGPVRAPIQWWLNWQSGKPFWGLSIPIWLSIVGALLMTTPAWHLDLLARRRAKLNLCPKCGYDRTGLAADAKCPECGVAPGGV